MKYVDGWYWPDGEEHMIEWVADPKNRMFIHGKPAYQGRKQHAAMGWCSQFRVAVDIGGHVGLWSRNLAERFETVIAFEPVFAHRECFAANVSALNVSMYPFALGELEGNVAIRSNPTSSGDSRVDGIGSIAMHRLDTYELIKVDFIKVDCEGYELLALKGGEQTIRRCRPTICVEQKPGMAQRFGNGERDAVTWLEGLGATLRQSISGDFILTFPE